MNSITLQDFSGKKKNLETNDDSFSFISNHKSVEFSKEIKKDEFDQRIADLIVGADKDFDLISLSNKDFVVNYKAELFDPIPLFLLPFEFLQLKFEGEMITLKLRWVNLRQRSQCLDKFSFMFPNSNFH